MTAIDIHISEGFPVLSLSLITEPLRVANRELGKEAFAWRVVADEPRVLQSSSGLPVAAQGLPTGRPDAAVLLASYHPVRAATAQTLAWLRRLDRQGVPLGCVDTGALVFARAGLLETRPAAAHPEAIEAFRRQFPKSLFVDRAYDISLPRFSSAGGVATLDMSLALIAHFATLRLARRVGSILAYAGPQAEFASAEASNAPFDPALRDALAIMRGSLGQPLGASEIARRVGVPLGRLQRLFRRHLNTSPTSHYVAMRLDQAREMLRNSTLSIGDVASGVGYDNLEVFSRAYKSRFGVPPSRDRMM